MTQAITKVDHSGLKTGQALTIILLVLGFVLNSWLLIAFVGLAQLMGGLGLTFAPYRLIYQYIIKPSGLIKPNIMEDNPQPHRFAMLVGAVFNGAATIALLANVSLLGWALVWVVIALANLNFWLNFCLGCWMYYQFNRLGIPGFTVAPIQE
ncbi:MAG: DUF4395 domain-containing protein [Phototrophicaceae bacterium]